PAELAQALAPFIKPRAAGGASPTPRSASVDAGTPVGRSTSKLKEVLKDATIKGPSKKGETTYHSAAGGKQVRATAWWQRPPVLAGAASAVAALLALIGVFFTMQARWFAKDGAQPVARGPEPAFPRVEPNPVQPKPAPPQSDVEKAGADMDHARDDAHKKLLVSFEAMLKRLARADQQPDESPTLAVVKAERERFEKRGLLPWSEPMRPY